MPQVLPFRGVVFNPAVVGDVRQVVAPPYDIIDAEGQKAFYARHPNNVIRLELSMAQATDTDSDNRYTRAARTLQEWLANGALARDAKPTFYLYTTTYSMPDGMGGTVKKTLTGYLGNFRLAALDSGEIYPHENTRAAAKTDRLNLMDACKSNFSPIWSLYSDPEGSVVTALKQGLGGAAPRMRFHDDDGFEQAVWAVDDAATVARVTELMRTKPLFIADGHHRYETALNYQRKRREQDGRAASDTTVRGYDQVMMLLTSLEDVGLTVLPTHRIVTTPVPDAAGLKALLSPAFDITRLPTKGIPVEQARKNFLETLRAKGRTQPCFGLAARGLDEYWLLALRPSHQLPPTASPRDRLDVSLLQQHVVTKLCPTQTELEAIVYTKDALDALEWVAKGAGQAALLWNATKVAEVRAVATAGERMPHKSTYFFPKPLTGLVLHVMEDRA
ncbi:MAG: DUF1015 domain-containing protein [Nitrospiraceae bacterium]